MTGWWWLVVILAGAGVLLLGVGFALMRRARPTTGVRGGFGGPPGSSDIGGHPGFGAPGPTDHWKAGAPLRIAGFAFLATAVVVGLVVTAAQLV